MNRESLLIVAAAAVVLVAGVVVPLVPGALAKRDETDVRASDLALRETTIRPASVGGQTVTLQLATYLRHEGGPAENVTVQVRVTDAASGMVATTETTRVGQINTTGERIVRTNVTVERQGSYVIETLVYEGDRRLLRGTTKISGLQALTPAYARSPVEFRRTSSGLPPVTFTVANATNGSADLAVTAALTNTGGTQAENLELVVLAQQADSNIVADRARTTVGTIRSGRTATPSVQLSVPDEYNYRVYAVLKQDGIAVETTRTQALLNPKREVPENTTTEEVKLEIGEFERDESAGSDGRNPTPTEMRTAGGSGPGFGAVAATLAALLLALGIRRRYA